MVSVAGIKPALQRPKRRVISFHYTEKTNCKLGRMMRIEPTKLQRGDH